jgi:N-acetylglucosaminyl-diphospho-decaprenol L-rhamnosyltransferase
MVSGMAPDISVVIVSYKVPALLRACLASLQREVAGCSYEVIVVENASGDGSAELVRDEFPGVRLIALEENIGFAAGSNVGARAAAGEYVLLLNPDTELVGDTLGALLRYARAHPEAGLVGGRTLRPDGELDPGSCWGAQSLWSLVCFASGLSSVFRGSQLFNPESLAGWSRDSERQVDIVTGCLCLTPRAVWEQLDGFDESFFMYGEDADLATRARKRGYHPAITPEAVILHHVGASSHSVDKREMNLRCRVALARKHWTPRRAATAVALLQVGTGVRALGASVTRRPSSTWPAVWRRRRDWRGGYA